MGEGAVRERDKRDVKGSMVCVPVRVCNSERDNGIIAGVTSIRLSDDVIEGVTGSDKGDTRTKKKGAGYQTNNVLTDE